MFEKEAEEWVENNLHSTEEDYIKAFKDGATFGYNKANEWQFVKDGDLPKEEKEYLAIYESDHTKYIGIESYYPDTKEWSTICKIIAWKEIVFPKEIAE